MTETACTVEINTKRKSNRQWSAKKQKESIFVLVGQYSSVEFHWVLVRLGRLGRWFDWADWVVASCRSTGSHPEIIFLFWRPASSAGRKHRYRDEWTKAQVLRCILFPVRLLLVIVVAIEHQIGNGIGVKCQRE